MADNAAELVSLTIDGVPLKVPKGTLLVEAAKQIKQEIPVYCYHTKLGPAGLCRVCLVEIEGTPKLQIACNTPVADGMVVRTQNAKVDAGRAMILELLLVNHPLDCPVCDKGGECDLQDYAMAYARGTSDLADPKTSKPKGVDLGPTIVLDEERCVVCQRCVRFDDIIVGDPQLVLKDRGVRDMIATASGDPYRHNFTGNVTELCPVGALTSKTYRFKSRPWDLDRTQTTCTQCSVGCQMFSDVRFGVPLRTMSVEHDDAISDGWLCDRGRYNIGFYDAKERITQPLYKRGDTFMQISWDDAFALWARAITDAIHLSGPQSVGTIGGGRLTNEEAYVAQYLFRALGVNNLDWRAGRQRQATPGSRGGTLADLERANAIVVLGDSPADRAPVLDLRIRKAVKRANATLVRVAPLDVSPVPSIDVVDVAQAAAALPATASSIAVVWDGIDAAAVERLLDALPENVTVRTYITSEQGNARGAETMGMHPRFAPGFAAAENGLDTEAMLAAASDGALAVLSIFGANPALRHPNGPLVRAALAKTPFVVVSELFMTESAKLATLVLPAKGAFEKNGTTLNATGDALPVNASLQAPEGVLSDLEMLVGLAEQLGVNLPAQEAVHAAVIEAIAQAPAFDLGDHAFRTRAAQAATIPADGLRVAVHSNVFAGDGTSAHDERIVALRPLAEALLSTDDAKVYGVSSGDRIDLEAGGLTLHNLSVAVRAGIARGTLVLVDGLATAPANSFAPGAVVRVVHVRKGDSTLVEA